jgi:hypothetical protein
MVCVRTVDGSTSSLFKLPNLQIFTTNGTYVTPADVDYIKVIAIGGGGGGETSASVLFGGTGGGASAPGVKFYGPGSYSYTIGIGGNGGIASPLTQATAGTNTVFDTTLKGIRGVNALTARGGAGGGTDGGSMYTLGRQAGGINTDRTCGYGGSNMYGTGGRGSYQGLVTFAGENGTGYGSGGSGASGTGAGSIGGNGSDGAVIIIEYF